MLLCNQSKRDTKSKKSNKRKSDEKGFSKKHLRDRNNLENLRKGGLFHWTIQSIHQFNMLVVWQSQIPEK